MTADIDEYIMLTHLSLSVALQLFLGFGGRRDSALIHGNFILRWQSVRGGHSLTRRTHVRLSAISMPSHSKLEALILLSDVPCPGPPPLPPLFSSSSPSNPPPRRKKTCTPRQVAALSQRRSEQANSASGASAVVAKGPLLSPRLSSTQSDRSGVSLGSNGVEEGLDDRDAELTDPFDELQAFFAGASLTDGPSPDGRKPASLKVRERFLLWFGHGSLSFVVPVSMRSVKGLFRSQPVAILSLTCIADSLSPESLWYRRTNWFIFWFLICLVLLCFVYFVCSFLLSPFVSSICSVCFVVIRFFFSCFYSFSAPA